MPRILLAGGLVSRTVKCYSNDADIAPYHFQYDKNSISMTIYKNESQFAFTDGRNILEYAVGKVLCIQREYFDIRTDRVATRKGEGLFTIKRSADIDGGAFCFDYTQAIDSSNDEEMLMMMKTWRQLLFLPVRVEAVFNQKFAVDDAIILLCITWLRYKYTSHDNFY